MLLSRIVVDMSRHLNPFGQVSAWWPGPRLNVPGVVLAAIPASVLRISRCMRTATTFDQSVVGPTPIVVVVRNCYGEPSSLVSNAYSNCRFSTPSESDTMRTTFSTTSIRFNVRIPSEGAHSLQLAT